MNKQKRIKKQILALLTAAIMLPFPGCGETPSLKAPSGSDNYKGQNYQLVINELENAGFAIVPPIKPCQNQAA